MTAPYDIVLSGPIRERRTTKSGSPSPQALGSARQNITDLIVFYTARGWDWLMPVAYLCDKAVMQNSAAQAARKEKTMGKSKKAVERRVEPLVRRF